jgi:hypothetical protein
MNTIAEARAKTLKARSECDKQAVRYQLKSAKTCSAKTHHQISANSPPFYLSVSQHTTHNQNAAACYKEIRARVFASAQAICSVQTRPSTRPNVAQTRLPHVAGAFRRALCLAVSEMGRIQLLGCGCTKPWVWKFASGAGS